MLRRGKIGGVTPGKRQCQLGQWCANDHICMVCHHRILPTTANYKGHRTVNMIQSIIYNACLLPWCRIPWRLAKPNNSTQWQYLKCIVDFISNLHRITYYNTYSLIFLLHCHQHSGLPLSELDALLVFGNDWVRIIMWLLLCSIQPWEQENLPLHSLWNKIKQLYQALLFHENSDGGMMEQG